ncbi:MAG: hypothetical protein E7546_07225 [Ruminococcaceae bacterium]|nr:hypothetical protein [Oscillospiraceae bacterium]
MNCKFCQNFVPDGSESCPVCGRRPEEEPIGELLAKANNGTLAAREEDTASSAKPEKDKKYKKGVIAPLATLGASVAGWVVLTGKKLFGSSTTVIEDVETLWNDMFNKGGTSIDETVSEFAEGGAATQAGSGLFTTQIAIIAGVTLIGVIGFIWLIKRFYNRIKH